jgi:hypothetical protein
MSTKTPTTLIALDDDPLGGVLLEPDTTFGAQAALLAGNIPGRTGAVDLSEMFFSATCSTATFMPPDTDDPEFDG